MQKNDLVCVYDETGLLNLVFEENSEGKRVLNIFKTKEQAIKSIAVLMQDNTAEGEEPRLLAELQGNLSFFFRHAPNRCFNWKKDDKLGFIGEFMGREFFFRGNMVYVTIKNEKQANIGFFTELADLMASEFNLKPLMMVNKSVIKYLEESEHFGTPRIVKDAKKLGAFLLTKINSIDKELGRLKASAKRLAVKHEYLRFKEITNNKYLKLSDFKKLYKPNATLWKFNPVALELEVEKEFLNLPKVKKLMNQKNMKINRAKTVLRKLKQSKSPKMALAMELAELVEFPLITDLKEDEDNSIRELTPIEAFLQPNSKIDGSELKYEVFQEDKTQIKSNLCYNTTKSLGTGVYMDLGTHETYKSTVKVKY